MRRFGPQPPGGYSQGMDDYEEELRAFSRKREWEREREKHKKRESTSPSGAEEEKLETVSAFQRKKRPKEKHKKLGKKAKVKESSPIDSDGSVLYVYSVLLRLILVVITQLLSSSQHTIKIHMGLVFLTFFSIVRGGCNCLRCSNEKVEWWLVPTSVGRTMCMCANIVYLGNFMSKILSLDDTENDSGEKRELARQKATQRAKERREKNRKKMLSIDKKSDNDNKISSEDESKAQR